MNSLRTLKPATESPLDEPESPYCLVGGRNVSHTRRSCIAVSLFAIAVSLCAALHLAGDEVKHVKTVSAADLSSRKVVVTGRLGAPLQHMMTIRGTWHFPETYPDKAVKDGSLRFRVSHVDGKELAEPVDFKKQLVHVTRFRDDDALPPADGATWEFRGYETGRFRERPPEYYAELGMAVQTAWPPEFTTELEGFIPEPTKPGQKPVQKAPSRGKKDSR